MTTEKAKVEVNLSKPKIRQEEERQVLYIAQKGKYQDVDYGKLYQKMWGEVKRQGLFSTGIEHLAIFYRRPESYPR